MIWRRLLRFSVTVAFVFVKSCEVGCCRVVDFGVGFLVWVLFLFGTKWCEGMGFWYSG